MTGVLRTRASREAQNKTNLIIVIKRNKYELFINI